MALRVYRLDWMEITDMWLINNLKERNKVVVCASFGIILSLTLIIGYEIYNFSDLSRLFYSFGTVLVTFIRFFIISLVASFLLMLLFAFISHYTQSGKCFGETYSRLSYILVFFITWIAVLFAFFMAFLAFYPGNLSYDFNTQSYYYNGILPFTRHHPPLHSFFLFWAIKYGTNHGIYAETPYALAQIVLLSLIIAVSVTYLMKLRVRIKVLVLFVLFYVCNPVVAIMAVSTTKDTLFGGLFLFVVIQLLYISRYKEEAFKDVKVWIIFGVSVTLCALMRNNAIYALILSVPVSVIIFKNYRKKTALLWALPIVCFFLVDSVLFGTVMPIPKGSSAEKLCVPMQQMAYTYSEKSDSMSAEEIEFVESYITAGNIADTYNPRFADPIKDTFDAKEYDTHKVEFWKKWIQLGLKYPSCYIDSFLNLNIPYWYIGADTIDKYAQRDYIEIIEDHRTRDSSKAPRFLSVYRRVATYEIVDKFPALGILFSITTPFWALLICVAYCLFNKQYESIVPLMPGVFLMLTFLAGPVSNFRYIFPIVMIYPCVFLIMGIRNDTEK